jgi:hypothetical protein
VELGVVLTPGNPAAQALPKGVKWSDYGVSYAESEQSPFPIHLKTAGIRVVVDAGGRTVGKDYFKCEVTHCGLFMVWSEESVAEIDVPAAVLVDPPAKWYLGEYPYMWTVTFNETSADANNRRPVVKGEDQEHADSAWPTGAPGEAAALPAKLSRSISHCVQKAAEVGIDPDAENVARYVLYVLVRLDSVPMSVPSDPHRRVLHMTPKILIGQHFSSGDTYEELFMREGRFVGASRTGYDRQFDVPGRGNLRIRNLGGGRLRIETQRAILGDPIIFPFITDMWYSQVSP